MVAKDLLMEAQQAFGIQTFTMPEDEIPKDDEELSMYMQLKYKPAIEIAEEEAINTVLQENHYDDIRKRIDYDIATLGIGIAKHEFLPSAGVKIDYVDPASVVYSYTEDPNFKDCFYWGEIKTVPMTEVKKIDPSLTREEMEKISQYSQSWYDYYNLNEFYDNDMFYRDTATLLYLITRQQRSLCTRRKC